MTSAAAMSADLRLLADLVDENPSLAPMFQICLAELCIFPHLHGVKTAAAVTAMFAPLAKSNSEGLRDVAELGLFLVRQLTLPGGAVRLHVYHEVSPEVKA